jgi:sec-independent protein translocase protein TatA
MGGIEKSMNTMFALIDFGGGQVLLVLALVLIFFGAKRIPDLAKGLGQGIREFKKATREVSDEIHNAGDASTPAQPANTQPRQITAATSPPEKTVAVPQSIEQKI